MHARVRAIKFVAMKPKTLYLALCILGVAVPYWAFVPWVLQHGLNLPLFLHELFANRIGAFFGMDVLVSAVALLVFTRIESSRAGVRHRWLVLVAVLTVGVSLALPLFLFLRERESELRHGAIAG
jgi:Terpene cyclase DEP1